MKRNQGSVHPLGMEGGFLSQFSHGPPLWPPATTLMVPGKRCLPRVLTRDLVTTSARHKPASQTPSGTAGLPAAPSPVTRPKCRCAQPPSSGTVADLAGGGGSGSPTSQAALSAQQAQALCQLLSAHLTSGKDSFKILL